MLDTRSASPWSPFRSRVFAVLWSVTVVSNIGTWMHDVGAGWLMTSLAPSPLMVALVQTATSLPIFLFALPAGALADIVDRRRLLIVVQSAMALLAAVLSVLVLAHRVTPLVLLIFTFLLGTCAAFVAPAWQALVPSLLAKESLQPAVALNGIGINISRAIGPALSGFLIAAISIAAPFALNAISFLGVIVALIWWRPRTQLLTALPAEQFWNAIVIGIRYARHSAPLQTTLIRAVAFFLFASAFWSLLPLVTRTHLVGGPAMYGLLLGSIGFGAVSGALLIPRLKQQLSANNIVVLGTCVIAATMLLNAYVSVIAISALASVLFGMGWICVLSTLNVAAQMAVPDWVRARGLSIYLMAFFGSMSAGSALWGAVANLTSLSLSLALAAAGALSAIVLTAHRTLDAGASADLAPSAHWPSPLVAIGDTTDRSPVMVTIEYRVNADNASEFLREVTKLGRARKRSGAYAWGIMQDAADSECFVEYFMEISWLQHLRHHERVSEADRAVQDKVNALHCGTTSPRVTHLLGHEVAAAGRRLT